MTRQSGGKPQPVRLAPQFLARPEHAALAGIQIFGGLFDPVTTVRFWSRVDKVSSPSGCWLWTGYCQRSGYGRFSIGGANYMAHRVSMCMHLGDLRLLRGSERATADAEFVLHSCDNPICVRPDHLRVGSPRDNTRDMLSRGRSKLGHCFGEDKCNSRLTAEMVRTIRREKRVDSVVARELGVSKSCVGHARIGRTWKNV